MAVRFQFDPYFREAFENVPHTVLGRKLRPFCLWHRFCLEMLDSPVLTGEPIDKIHLLGAVIVCQSQFDGTGYVPTFPSTRGILRSLYWRMKLRRFDLRKEVDKFSDYLTDFHSAPKLWPDESGEKPNTVFAEIDPLLDLAVHLISKGMSPVEAWNTPLGMSNWYSVTLLKLEGRKVDVWTPQDEHAYQKHLVDREKKLSDKAAVRAAEKGIPVEEARKEVDAEYWAEVKERKVKQKAMEKSQERLGARTPMGMAGGGRF